MMLFVFLNLLISFFLVSMHGYAAEKGAQEKRLAWCKKLHADKRERATFFFKTREISSDEKSQILASYIDTYGIKMGNATFLHELTRAGAYDVFDRLRRNKKGLDAIKEAVNMQEKRRKQTPMHEALHMYNKKEHEIIEKSLLEDGELPVKKNLSSDQREFINSGRIRLFKAFFRKYGGNVLLKDSNGNSVFMIMFFKRATATWQYCCESFEKMTFKNKTKVYDDCRRAYSTGSIYCYMSTRELNERSTKFFEIMHTEETQKKHKRKSQQNKKRKRSENKDNIVLYERKRRRKNNEKITKTKKVSEKHSLEKDEVDADAKALKELNDFFKILDEQKLDEQRNNK
ncbi:MAG TPA: hypothetical protein VEK38_02455 [Candidatus Bathyarchaeia archaeon]|nr:hypothetical protein [Candidatus Bathyarchaeia archaeon]